MSLVFRKVVDWNDAYANGPNIPGGERWPAAWVGPAQAYRDALARQGRARLDQAYGEAPRQRYDLFLPERAPRGLVVFVHGGFWRALDNSYWSHLAAGPVERGFAVAMPSYTLAPAARIGGIVVEVAAAVSHAAAAVEGPLMLAGHSAGGQLVSRMIAAPSPLTEAVRGRIRTVLSISGVHDLRPMLSTAMNADLRIDAAEARAESPALLEPLPGARVICWVGAAERAEFVRQNALLANIWTGLGVPTCAVEEPDRHHFNVIDGLADPHHPMVEALVAA
ncbi:MAG: alpha/beta hydrolase [Xanthobacteraceae bacterium]